MNLDGRISRVPVRLTKAGWWFVGAAVFTGIAAYHSANNVVFLGLSFLLSGLLLNGLVSWWNFSRLRFPELRVYQPRSGEPAEVILDMIDYKKVLPSYGLIAVLEIVSPSGDTRWVRRFVRRAGSKRSLQIAFPWTPSTRGSHRIRLTRIESTFPFGLIQKNYPMRLTIDALVWPSKLQVSGEVEFLSDNANRFAESRQSIGSLMDDIEGLRGYRTGDPMRHIHWRKTAQNRIPVVKVGRGQQGRPHYRLAFDFEKRHFQSERDVGVYCSFVGSLTERILDGGRKMQIILHSGAPLIIGSSSAWHRLMDALSLIEPIDEGFPGDSIRKSGFRVLSPSDAFRMVSTESTVGLNSGFPVSECHEAEVGLS